MSESNRKKSARASLVRAGYKAGGSVKNDEAEDKRLVRMGVHKHESALHPGEPKTKLKDGGAASGEKSRSRADKSPRGKTTINIVVGTDKQQAPVPMPVPPMAAPAPRPPMPAGAPGMPVGLKSGGRLGKAGPKMTGGAASGVGREEKAELQKSKR